MRRFAIIILIFIGVSYALGWGHATGDHVGGNSDEDVWSVMPVLRGDIQVLTQVGKNIRSTELFILSRKAERALAETLKSQQVSARPNAPPFPSIGSVSKVNNTYWATFIMADGAVLSRTIDDSLPGGWVIKAVDLRQVIAVFDDEESRFPVAAYLDKAFEKPEDVQDPLSGGKN